MRGWSELEHDRQVVSIRIGRRIAYFAAAPHVKGLREDDVWPLEEDEDKKKELIKQFGYVKVIKPDATEQ